MTIKTSLLLLLLICTLTTAAFAGNKGGNGGGAFICQDPAQSEFLDLYQAEKDGLKIPTSNDPEETQIINVLNKLKTSEPVYDAVMEVYSRVRSAKVTVLPKGSLLFPSDERTVYGKPDCPGYGIMLFDDSDNSIQQDLTYLSSLPPTQRAAAWVHETMYKFFRETRLHERTSIRTQKIVGHLFSDESPDELKKSLETLGLNMSVKKSGFIENLETPGFKINVYVANRSNAYQKPVTFNVGMNLNANSDSGCKMTAQPKQSVQLNIDLGLFNLTYSNADVKAERSRINMMDFSNFDASLKPLHEPYSAGEETLYGSPQVFLNHLTPFSSNDELSDQVGYPLFGYHLLYDPFAQMISKKKSVSCLYDLTLTDESGNSITLNNDIKPDLRDLKKDPNCHFQYNDRVTFYLPGQPFNEMPLFYTQGNLTYCIR